MSPFNQPRNILHDKAALFLRFADRSYAEIRLQSGKRIISNLRPSRRYSRNQRRLANIGIAHQPHISQQLEFQPKDALFAGPTLFVLTRSLMRGCSKARIPAPAAPAVSNYHAFIRAGKIVDLLARFRVIHNRAHRHFQQNVRAFASLAVRTLAMTSALRLVLRIETEVNQSVVALAGFHNDAAAIPAVAPGWPTPRNILLPPQSQTAIPAIPSLHPNCGLIDKHENLRFPLCTFVSSVVDELQMLEPQRTQRYTKERELLQQKSLGPKARLCAAGTLARVAMSKLTPQRRVRSSRTCPTGPDP